MNYIRANEKAINQMRAFLVLNDLDMPEFSRFLDDLDFRINVPQAVVRFTRFTMESAPLESGWFWENRSEDAYSVDQYVGAPGETERCFFALQTAPTDARPYTPGMAVITIMRAFDARQALLDVDVHAKLAPRL